MGEFADVLQEIGTIEPADLDVLRGLSTKYPALDNAAIRAKELTKRQSAFEREKTSLESKRDELQAKLAGWDTWRDNNWLESLDNPADGMTKGEKQAREQLAQTTARLAEMEAGTIPIGGVSMEQNDFAAVTAYLDEKGYAKKSDISALAPKADLDAVRTTHGQALNGFETIYRRATPFITRYAREFPELNDDFDLSGFTDYLVADANRTQDIGKAYEEFVAPKKAQLAMKKEADRLEALGKELDAKQAALATAATSGSSPTDTSSAAPEVGHFQRRLMNGDKKPEGEVNAPLGSGVNAAIAAEKYRKGEFATKEVQ